MKDNYTTPFTICSKASLADELPYSLATFYQALGLSEDQAYNAAENISIIRITTDLFNALRRSPEQSDTQGEDTLADRLSAAVKAYSIRSYTIAMLIVANVAPKAENELTQEEAERLANIIGRHYPNQIGSFFLQFRSEDGTINRLRSWNSEVIVIIRSYFAALEKWFKANAEKISPQFEAIKDEIEEYLKNNYGGINPSQNGFVQWFLSNKQGRSMIQFHYKPLPAFGPNDFEIVGVEINIPNDEQYPAIIEWHLHEYCEWKLQQQELIKANIKQSALTTPFKGVESVATTSYPGSTMPSSFPELFTDAANLDKCINALRLIDSPVINMNGEWIGGRGSKSVLVAWIERLESIRKIQPVNDKKVLIKLLNSYFPNLNLGADGRIFGENNNHYLDAKDQFAALILP